MKIQDLTTSQLREIERIIETGVMATSSDESTAADTCNMSPPKGYPKDKSMYGDPECYRYPLDTKSRCLAAWRYVHQSQNRKVLGDKASKVTSRIKSFAKEHYDMVLEEQASVDWEVTFRDYYDSETNYTETNSDEVNAVNEEKMNELEARIAALEEEKNTVIAEKQVMESELVSLREYKSLKEAEEAKATLMKARKEKAQECGIELTEEDRWFDMNEDTFDFVLSTLKETKNAAATKNMPIPPTNINNTTEKTAKDVLRGYLK